MMKAYPAGGPALAFVPQRSICAVCRKKFKPYVGMFVQSLIRMVNHDEERFAKEIGLFVIHNKKIGFKSYRLHEHPDVCSKKCKTKIMKSRDGWEPTNGRCSCPVWVAPDLNQPGVQERTTKRAIKLR